jgi:hypothetical protein
MTPTVLTLRINRRAVGAAVLDHEVLTFADGRHLTSKPEQTVRAAVRFLGYLLALTKPTLLVLDAPPEATGSTSARITDAVKELATRNSLPVLSVSKPEVLAAYGLHGIRSRGELRQLVRHYWPELAQIRGKVEPFVTDAAAAALYADCRIVLERVVS